MRTLSGARSLRPEAIGLTLLVGIAAIASATDSMEDGSINHEQITGIDHLSLPYEPLPIQDALVMVEYAVLADISFIDQQCLAKWHEYIERIANGDETFPRPTCNPYGGD